MGNTRTKSGLECLAEENFACLAGKNVALLANQAAIDSRLVHIKDLLLRAAPQVKLCRLFAPEHGFCGTHQDMDSVKDSKDQDSGIPVISLYGSSPESLRPRPQDLADIEVLLVDLPDIGSRYYTFAQSMIYCMQTAAQTGTQVIVLDRPNPIGGTLFEGSPLESRCRSFCGYLSVPQRHGLSLGELALMANSGFGSGEERTSPINCELKVIEALNWGRELWYDQTSLPWVMPSVNMPTLDTAAVYPGACLFEATNISEGRGTTRPFELLGAPFINSKEWIAAVQRLDSGIIGATLRPTSFTPKFQKHADCLCHGVQIHVHNRSSFRPFRTSLALIYTAAQLFKNDFQWRHEAYEFVDKVPAIDLLYGSADFRTAVESAAGLSQIFEDLENYESSYREARKDFLLYNLIS